MECFFKYKWQQNSIQIDTDAEVNVISKAEFNTLKSKPKLSDTNIKLTAYNNTKKV